MEEKLYQIRKVNKSRPNENGGNALFFWLQFPDADDNPPLFA